MAGNEPELVTTTHRSDVSPEAVDFLLLDLEVTDGVPPVLQQTWDGLAGRPQLRRYISEAARRIAPDDLAERGRVVRGFLGLVHAEETDTTAPLDNDIEGQLGVTTTAEPVEATAKMKRRRWLGLGAAAMLFSSHIRKSAPESDVL